MNDCTYNKVPASVPPQHCWSLGAWYLECRTRTPWAGGTPVQVTYSIDFFMKGGNYEKYHHSVSRLV